MKSFLFLIGITLLIKTEAQQSKANGLDAAQIISGIKPRCIGPSGLGRVNSISVFEKNTNIFFVAMAHGGVWRTLDGGNSWKAITESSFTCNAGAVTVNQNNPAIVWVGTGDGFPRNTMGLGEGIYKSVDTGNTWKFVGLKSTMNIHQILIDPENSDNVFVGVTGDAFNDHEERGVFKTEDGGQTWKRILFTNSRSGCSDLIMDPSNPKTLYAGMWEHYRKPWIFSSGGEGSGLYKTTNGGKKWTKISSKNGLPKEQLGRIGIAISKSAPKVIYALIESQENNLYKSTDGGKHFALINQDDKIDGKYRSIHSRPFYFQKIFCDPHDVDIIWRLDVEVWKSIDGGLTFKEVKDRSGAGFHADHHVMYLSLSQKGLMLEGNDGWLSLSKDAGESWTRISPIPTAQAYSVSIGDGSPYHISGGLQDNGNWLGISYTWGYDKKLSDRFWRKLRGGDGFGAIQDAINPNIFWTIAQGGNISKIDVDAFAARQEVKHKVDGSRYNWNTPLTPDPFCKGQFYLGCQYLLKGDGNKWRKISPDLSQNDSTKIVPYAIAEAIDNKTDISFFNKFKDYPKHGGLSNRELSGAEVHCTITTIAPSPIDSLVIWVGTDDGNVQLTKNGGRTWENVSLQIPGLPKNTWISKLFASENLSSEAFVVANNYRLGDHSCYVFHTQDNGKTWRRLAESLREYAVSFLQDSKQPKLMFLGTEKGLYVSIDSGVCFKKWDSGLPIVTVSDMKIQEKENDLVLATFGRSFWVIDDITPLREVASSDSDLVQIFMKPLHTVLKRSLLEYNETNPFYQIQTTNRPEGISTSVYLKESLPKVLSGPLCVIELVYEDGKKIQQKELYTRGFHRLFLADENVESKLKSGKYVVRVTAGGQIKEKNLYVSNLNE